MAQLAWLDHKNDAQDQINLLRDKINKAQSNIIGKCLTDKMTAFTDQYK